MANEVQVQKDLSNTIESTRDLSIQERARGKEFSGSSFLWMAVNGDLMPPWWSKYRDKKLRDFWKQPDHLAGAVYAMESKMTAIPFTIEPVDKSNKRHFKQAKNIQDRLFGASEFGEGWLAFYGKFLEDLLTTDNGAFAEVLGAGDPRGPIIGEPISVAHLDSYRCTRTGDPEYPVLFRDQSGRSYKLHYTRVIYASQMSSPISEMNGVGVCAISRCINVSQNLLDMVTYKQEKLGSRPHRGIMVTKGGLDPNDVANGLRIAAEDMDNQNLKRYSKIALVGSSTITEAGLELIDLSGLPDGFNEETAITFGMAAIALAFGVDARELFPSMSSGATRADALLQHLKQRGKGPGQIIQMTETQFNFKFLPPHLKMVFDFQDDAQDLQVAQIRKTRMETYNLGAMSKNITKRVVREQMLESGDISRSQFEEMELDDGRLEDGTNIVALFYTKDSDYKKYLSIGVDDVLDIQPEDIDGVLEVIDSNMSLALEDLIDERDPYRQSVIRRSLAALKYLRDNIVNAEQSVDMQVQSEEDRQIEQQSQQQGSGVYQQNPNPNPAVKRPNRQKNPNQRLRRQNLLTPNTSVELSTSQQASNNGANKEIDYEVIDGKEVVTSPLSITPEIRITLPEQPKQAPPVVNVTVPQQAAPNIVVNVPKQELPQINVNVPKQDAPKINVNIPKQDTPDINLLLPDAESKENKTIRKRNVKVVRDLYGKITAFEVEEEK